MTSRLKTIAAGGVIALALAGGASAAAAAGNEPGSSAQNPIIVTSLDDVPENAVEDEVSTYETPDNKCDTTRSFVVPGKDAVTHIEYRYYRDVAATEEVSHKEYRYPKQTREFVPGSAEVSHLVYSYSKEVKDTKTQYHFAKFTRTKTKAPDVKGFWQEFSPTKPKTFNGPPSYPTDSRGKWSAKKTNGGPQPDASGVFQNGVGNGSWFYRQQTVTSDWSEYGPWTKWSPETHTSWEDSTDPLGSPQFHGSGTYSDGTKWYREWQARFDGKTRTVPNGSHTEYSGEVLEPLGEPWVLLAGYPKKVVDKEQVPDSYTKWADAGFTEWSRDMTKPEDTDLVRYGEVESQTVVDTPAEDGYRLYYVVDDEPTRDLDEASWVKESPGEGWTQLDSRTVTDSAEVSPVYYAWSDDKECETTPTPTDTPTKTPTTPGRPSQTPTPPTTIGTPTSSPSPSVTPSPQPRFLAQTGSDILMYGGFIGCALIALGGVTLAAARNRNRKF